MGSVEQRARDWIVESVGPLKLDRITPEEAWRIAYEAGFAAALREQPEARGVVDAPIEGPRLPSGGSIESKAKAWDEVVNVMDEVCPDWVRRSKVGAWAVCAAIREMAAAQQPGQEGGGEGLGEGGRYWRERAEFWRSQAVALGWREKRDAENGEAAPPSAPVGVDELVATLIDAAYQDGTQEMDEMSADTLRARSAVVQALTQQPAQAAPGWKLVPVEPTDGMLTAYYEADRRRAPCTSGWRAMLAAAPTPPGDDAAGGGS